MDIPTAAARNSTYSPILQGYVDAVKEDISINRTRKGNNNNIDHLTSSSSSSGNISKLSIDEGCSYDGDVHPNGTPEKKQRFRLGYFWDQSWIRFGQSVHQRRGDTLTVSEEESFRTISSTLIYNNATWFSCYINLTSTIIGAGILGVPYAFSKSGWVLGTILLFTCSFLSGFGLHLLSICGKKVPVPSSFYAVAEISVPKFSMLIDVAVAVKCLGITTSYLIVIGDSLPVALQQLGAHPLLCSRKVCIFLAMTIIGPISFFPKLDSLKHTSFISGLMILSLVGLIFLYSLHSPALDPCANFSSEVDCMGDRSLFVVNLDTLRSLPISIFGFSCQQNTFAVVNELHRPTQSRMNSIFLAAMLTTLVIYLFVAYCGYLTYGSNLKPDILNMYPENDITSLCRLMVSFIMTCHYPLQLNPYRKSLLSLLNSFCGPVEDCDGSFRCRYFSVTVLTLGFTFMVSMLVDDLGMAFSVVGATGASLVIFILPGIFYYTIHKNAANHWRIESEDPSLSVHGPTSSPGRKGSKPSNVIDFAASNPLREEGDGLSPSDRDYSLPSSPLSFSVSEGGREGRESILMKSESSWKTYAALGMFIIGMIVGPLALILIFLS